MLNRHPVLGEFNPADFRDAQGRHPVERPVGSTSALKLPLKPGQRRQVWRGRPEALD